MTKDDHKRMVAGFVDRSHDYGELENRYDDLPSVLSRECCDDHQPGLDNHGVGQQPKEKSDRRPEPREVDVLGKLVGTWGPSANNFNAMKAKWVVNETYVQIDKRFNDADKVDTMTLLGWNKQKKAYCCWQFGRLDDGSPAEGEGAWNDKSHTLTFTCAANAEGAAIVIAYTVDGDSLTYKEGTKGKGGKVNWGLTCEWSKRHE